MCSEIRFTEHFRKEYKKLACPNKTNRDGRPYEPLFCTLEQPRNMP